MPAFRMHPVLVSVVFRPQGMSVREIAIRSLCGRILAHSECVPKAPYPQSHLNCILDVCFSLATTLLRYSTYIRVYITFKCRPVRVYDPQAL